MTNEEAIKVLSNPDAEWVELREATNKAIKALKILSFHLPTNCKYATEIDVGCFGCTKNQLFAVNSMCNECEDWSKK